MEQLHKFLRGAGFAAYPQRSDDERFCTKVLFQRELPDLARSEPGTPRKLHLNVTTWLYSSRVPAVEMCEVDITGEMPDGSWAKFQAYAIDPAELPLQLATVEARLKAAWRAAVEVSA